MYDRVLPDPDDLRSDQRCYLAAISGVLGGLGLKAISVDAPMKSGDDEYSVRRAIADQLAGDPGLASLVANVESKHHWARTRHLLGAVQAPTDEGQLGRFRAASKAVSSWTAVHPSYEVSDSESDGDVRRRLLALQALLLLADELSPT